MMIDLTQIDIMGMEKFGDRAILAGVLIIIFFCLTILREYLKKKRDRGTELLETVSDALVIIKEQITAQKEQVSVMNQILNEMRGSMSTATNIIGNTYQNIGELQKVCNDIKTDVKVLTRLEERSSNG